MKEFKLNDKVFDIRFGWGIVTDNNNYNEYPIIVKYIDNNVSYSYTADGKYCISNKNPSLSHTEYSINTTPFQERVVEVAEDSNFNFPYKRVLHMIKNGMAICWNSSTNIEDSKRTNSLTSWNYWREIPEKEKLIELTLEDISNGKGVGVPVHLIRIKK